jgi:hypothetical protein
MLDIFGITSAVAKKVKITTSVRIWRSQGHAQPRAIRIALRKSRPSVPVKTHSTTPEGMPPYK